MLVGDGGGGGAAVVQLVWWWPRREREKESKMREMEREGVKGGRRCCGVGGRCGGSGGGGLVVVVVVVPMGVDMRMNLSLFFTTFISSIFVLAVFHLVFLGLWYIRLVSPAAGRRPKVLTIGQNCTVLSVACCVFYSVCGNYALNESQFGGKDSLWKTGERSELRDECKSWFAQVGPARDHSILFKWIVFGESSDEFSPIFSLWATFIGLYIANFVVERSSGWALTNPLSAEEIQRLKDEQRKPKFLDMVPWYSGTSADLFKTVFDLLVSVTVFMGRFDMRMMQAAMSGVHEGAKAEDFLYDHFSEKSDFWFDFMADTGDGGNSSYSVARLLAQPSLDVKNKDSSIKLPRGDLLLIGGDLAYPNPSTDTYEKRFFYPFEEALRPPSWYKKDHIAVNKPELPVGVSDLKQYDGPQCFVIPGNHDWFDGLQTFMRYICQKSWLGGWLMPQKKSYFALQLPKGWWVFGLDLALYSDIDSYQFKFFSELIHDKVKENDPVIVMTHAPNWILDYYWNEATGKNVTHLIRDHLKGRCKLRIAGDLHHYMRHSYVQSEKPAMVQHLLVNGCGGAFLHPTHVFGNLIEAHDATYETKSTYPSVEDSRGIALGNILKFRKENWQFDFIGGSIYFILTFSMFPLCKLDHILQDDTFSGIIKNFFGTVWDAFLYMVGYHSLYNWYRTVEGEHFPDATGLWVHVEQWTFGLYPACIKYLMSAFDVPEVMAVTRTNICKNGMVSLSRGGAVIYYVSVFLYFWVLSTPAVSLIFGSYLYICINWLHLHFDEAFSSLRIANFKSFTRFHIMEDGNLEVFTLAVDKVPKEWKRDSHWQTESTKQKHLLLSHQRQHPSKWSARAFDQDPINKVRIIDQFVIQRYQEEENVPEAENHH
ncbi:hypothetical protein M8C21_020985 [Ambrosia artemisiifolia]|uniref:Calcineurin-like phosphoesterase domain-containing protein n=1 Tax=Ambrosia artemisiifolia TaxID=4212 RepID=A0AAD5GCQ3_AMBAR|nr:hypothetical protein M8C21_020985 [Ambrosia artemisiifolia]